MLNDGRQNISIKESLNFYVLSGAFVYFVCSIPLILFRLFPPVQPEGLNISFTTIYPPRFHNFILGISVFALIGSYLLNKLNLKNRIAHFSILALFLSIGGGALTGISELIYFVFIIGDSFTRAMFYAELPEYWFGFKYAVEWLIVFLLAIIPFTILYLFTTSIITKFKYRNSLK